MIICRDNLSASTKNKKLTELEFQDVYVVPFQCSKHSTAAAIKDRWDFGVEYQKAGTTSIHKKLSDHCLLYFLFVNYSNCVVSDPPKLKTLAFV